MNSAYILVYNTEGKLLLQLRSQHDESYPLHYDFSAAGGIEEGESIEEAAKRELMEELGIESELDYLGEIKKMHMFKTIYSGDFKPGPEVESVSFHSLEEIRDMIKRGEKFHPEFIQYISS